MITCITVNMTEMNDCVIRDEHYDKCDGAEYFWHTEHDRWETTGKPCAGCSPRPAETGLVCAPCWRRITSALAGYPDMARMLAGVDRAVQRDGEGMGAHGGPRVPISPVQLALEQIRSFFTKGGSTPEQWVSSEGGARDAVRFAKAYVSASNAHPTRETPHRVVITRCPDCRQKSLAWNPPASETAEVRIRCRNPECSYDVDQSTFEALINPAPQEEQAE